MFNQSLSGSWFFRPRDTQEWMPATVPGSVHTDLLALGKIPDPFVSDNEKKVQWITDCDWEYRRVFTFTPPISGFEMGGAGGGIPSSVTGWIRSPKFR